MYSSTSLSILHKGGGGYDVVCSWGFIEHFQDYLDVIMEHDKILAKNGLLIIFVPNFRGFFQQTAHRIFDIENLNHHVLASMNPNEWAETLRASDYEILFCGYCGGIDFWTGRQKRNIVQRVLLRVLRKTVKVLRKFVKRNSSLYSPYCGIIARKN